MFPSAAPRGNIKILGKQNELFPSGPVIKCLTNNKDLQIQSENLHGGWKLTKGVTEVRLLPVQIVLIFMVGNNF